MSEERRSEQVNPSELGATEGGYRSPPSPGGKGLGRGLKGESSQRENPEGGAARLAAARAREGLLCRSGTFP